MASTPHLLALTSLTLLLNVSGLTSAADAATTAAATAADSAPSCRTHDLAASIRTRGGGTAGSLYVRLVLRNISARACYTRGFPGVSYLADNNTQVGAPADWIDPMQVRTLRVRPGGRVVATLREIDAANYPSRHCRPRTTDGLQIYPPNQTTSTFVPQVTTGCRNDAVHLLTVTPLRRLT